MWREWAVGALVGTITELTPVSEIDGFHYRTDGLLADLRRRYLAVMRRAEPLEGVEFATLKASAIESS